MDKNKIGFIGAGNMAQAMIKGLVASKIKNKPAVYAYDINSAVLNKTCKLYRVRKAVSNAGLAKTCGILVLAVKPQQVGEVLGSLKGVVTGRHLLISIAAGVSIGKLQFLLGVKAPIVRVMPNTPAFAGEGAAGYCLSKEVKPKDKRKAEAILSAFCRVTALLPETDINTVTALSGSGPAYVYYFAEAMLQAAEELNFDRKKAKELIIQTFKGAAALMEVSGDSPETLRLKVTSKGGTTERAINIMEAGGVKETIRIAVKSAKQRADELGQ